MTLLDQGSEFLVHGNLDVPALTNGLKYRVKSVERGSKGVFYVLEELKSGLEYRVKTSHIEEYIESKAFIEVYSAFYESEMPELPYIERL